MAWSLCSILLLIFLYFRDICAREIFTNFWAVKVRGGQREAKELAEKYGFSYDKHLFQDYHVFKRPELKNRSVKTQLSLEIDRKLEFEPQVEWFMHQKEKKYELFSKSLSDPRFDEQWYIKRPAGSTEPTYNILSAWKAGYTGKGIWVAVVDDGVDGSLPELSPNYNLTLSYDYVDGNDVNPSEKKGVGHGNRCAGIIAGAADNGICGGRGGLGAIYTFSAGNGGLTGDSCAYNGYVNSIYTIAINGVNKDGSRPSYAEECPGIMATTFSRDSLVGKGTVIRLNLDFSRRGDLSLQLTAPSGTVSPLTRKRVIDNITGYRNLTDWIITTLFHWGEDPTGSWELNIDDFDKNIPSKGNPENFLNRRANNNNHADTDPKDYARANKNDHSGDTGSKDYTSILAEISSHCYDSTWYHCVDGDNYLLFAALASSEEKASPGGEWRPTNGASTYRG
ncbi:Furin-1 [Stylophora pistillata]|uniref:Furin-1 n=1 Tax=Stylophora pistillata TaxID=50429 RepID=A0A2B4RZK2_STYPI|nr:Furin-1 [Stylophora pistillata]